MKRAVSGFPGDSEKPRTLLTQRTQKKKSACTKMGLPSALPNRMYAS